MQALEKSKQSEINERDAGLVAGGVFRNQWAFGKMGSYDAVLRPKR